MASTTNEALLYEVLIRNAKDDKEKAYYITQYLDLIKDTNSSYFNPLENKNP